MPVGSDQPLAWITRFGFKQFQSLEEIIELGPKTLERAIWQLNAVGILEECSYIILDIFETSS